MAAIRRAFLRATGLVLFNEPSQGLAPKIVLDEMQAIPRLRAPVSRRWSSSRTHPRCLPSVDRAHAIDRGRIVHEGKTGDLLADLQLRTVLLGC